MTSGSNRRSTSSGRRTGIDPILVFCVLSLASIGILFLCFLLSHGNLIERYFFHDTRDTGMDFFHSLEYVNARAPYKLFDTLYPPLANLFFYLLYSLIPKQVVDAWPLDFDECTAMRGSHLDSRTFQAPMLLFIVFILLTAWVLITMVQKLLRYRRWGSVTAFCLLFAPGTMWAFERGNILVLAMLLCLFFVQFRNSKNMVMRELALLALAAAAGFKLYPAFFGVLLLKDKQYAKAVRAVIYGILSIILPMLFFTEGLSGLGIWLSVVFGFGSNAESSLLWVGTGFTNIMHSLTRLFQLEDGTGSSLFPILGMIITVLLLISALLLKKDWQSYIAVILAITLFQGQANYIFCLTAIPLVYFFRDETALNRSNVVPFMLLTALTIHLPLFYTYKTDYPDVIVKQIVLVLLAGWCIFNAFAALQPSRKNRSHKLRITAVAEPARPPRAEQHHPYKPQESAHTGTSRSLRIDRARSSKP